MIEQYDPVLSGKRSCVRIVIVPEIFEQFRISYDGGIIAQEDRFAMVADPVIGRILRFSAGIPDLGGYDSFKTPKQGVWTPESAHCKGCRLQVLVFHHINLRNVHSPLTSFT